MYLSLSHLIGTYFTISINIAVLQFSITSTHFISRIHLDSKQQLKKVRPFMIENDKRARHKSIDSFPPKKSVLNKIKRFARTLISDYLCKIPLECVRILFYQHKEKTRQRHK